MCHARPCPVAVAVPMKCRIYFFGSAEGEDLRDGFSSLELHGSRGRDCRVPCRRGSATRPHSSGLCSADGERLVPNERCRSICTCHEHVCMCCFYHVGACECAHARSCVLCVQVQPCACLSVCTACALTVEVCFKATTSPRGRFWLSVRSPLRLAGLHSRARWVRATQPLSLGA